MSNRSFTRIGLTGCSGSGKSLVAALLTEKGIPCLDTDALVHSFYEGGEYPSKLAALFGKSVLTSSGAVDRRALSEIVFADKDKLELLNRTVHGSVRAYCLRWMDEKKAAGYAAAAVDAPQLFEAKMENDFDSVIAVYAPQKDRIRRIMARDGIGKAAAMRRIASQKPASFYRTRCDLLVRNPDGSDTESLAAQLLPFLRQLLPEQIQ